MSLLGDKRGHSFTAQPKFIGDSDCVEHLRAEVSSVARRDCTVLIHGESGAGKELVARAIHTQSRRSGRLFMPVDCTAFSEALFESQLFGHVRGAFTGAEQPTLGFFRAADGGTLFLDEIGELPLTVQAKLLRAIQERTVVPLGGTEPLAADVRVIAATHRRLGEMVADGRFRQDLYFRINVVGLSVPPLRDRRDDISRLAQHFLQQFAELYDEPTKKFSADAMAALRMYDWPGNVRELQNAIEHACVFCPDRTIPASNLPDTVRDSAGKNQTITDPDFMTLEQSERLLIARAMHAASGNQTRAARLLRIERHRLHRKIVQYGLESLTGQQRR